MTQEQIMEVLNEQFKNFFKAQGFKVRKEHNGMKATKEDVTLTFYIGYDQFANWYRAQEHVDSQLWVKLPYTDYQVAHYYFKLDTALTLEVLDKIFTDSEFLALLEFEMPKIKKKII
jgi:hypothetical protein